jgi:hypothetical protein
LSAIVQANITGLRATWSPVRRRSGLADQIALSEPDIRFEAHCGLNPNIAPCEKCHFRTHALQQTAASFNHPVGAGK